ncbi:uncharacterized protein C9orf50 homolog [Rhynchonycteris naso]
MIMVSPLPPSLESQHQKGVSERWPGYSPHCPNCSFLPDLRAQSSSNFQNSLKKILLHQIPALGQLRRDPEEQFTKVKKANKPYGLQAPKLKALLTHSSSGESSGSRRRCPFRVRFADETLWDTALRYWERSCALQQGIVENKPATQSAAPERVFGGIRRWLESLPKALCSRAKEDTVASSPFGWNSPGLPILQLQRHLSEDTSMNSSLPLLPRATAQRQQRDSKTLLGTHSVLDQMGKSPCSWSQKLESLLPHLELKPGLKRGRSQRYQPLLPSAVQPQAQR